MPACPSATTTSRTAPPPINDILFFWPDHHSRVLIQPIYGCTTLPRLHHLFITPTRPQLEDFYECFSFAYNSWMKVSAVYELKLSTDKPLSIKRLGAIGIDKGEHLRRLGVPSGLIATPAILAPLRTDPNGKRRKSQLDDSDKEVEIFNVSCVIKQEPVSPSCPVKRPRPVISTSTAVSPSLPSLTHSASYSSDSIPSPASSPDFPALCCPWRSRR
ncbi:hypothetical protein B0H15DRAFT_413314 [Mycena belliarum]|uniref:Uncharacterized protein n=1 Tax=Mycena belliarum TaxID=1033014 RepID=A0AAD6XTA8_9AGAR|nr:hypothetical protein B0H15DRAFT_413314 [Mycena belliae]